MIPGVRYIAGGLYMYVSPKFHMVSLEERVKSNSTQVHSNKSFLLTGQGVWFTYTSHIKTLVLERTHLSV